MAGGANRIEGTLTSWNDDRGYGFLTPTSGRGRAFVHITAFSRGTARPRVGETFSYEVDRHGDRGPAAVRVTATGARWSAPRGRAPRPSRTGWVALAVAVLVAAGLVWVLVERLDRATPWLPWAALAISVVTGVVYGVDKRAARDGTARVPERTLLLLGLFGGWPGAVVAQQLLRHKTSKRSFQLAFWATVLVDVVVVAVLAIALSG